MKSIPKQAFVFIAAGSYLLLGGVAYSVTLKEWEKM